MKQREFGDAGTSWVAMRWGEAGDTRSEEIWGWAHKKVILRSG